MTKMPDDYLQLKSMINLNADGIILLLNLLERDMDKHSSTDGPYDYRQEKEEVKRTKNKLQEMTEIISNIFGDY